LTNFENLGLEIRNSERHGSDWLWPKSDWHCWKHLNKSRFAFLPTEMSTVVKNKNLVIQAGGNCGIYPKQFSNIFQSVITFEPDPLNFFCLSYNVRESNVYKFQACLGNSNNTLGIGKHDKLKDSNIGAHKTASEGNVPQIMIDNLNLKPDLIQLDLEGFEGPALEGAEYTIKKFKPVITIEAHGFGEDYGYSQERIDTMLFNWGYQIYTKWSDDIMYVHKDY